MTLRHAETPSLADRGPQDAPQRPPSPRGISIRPAMTVLVLALVILAAFVTIGVLTSQHAVVVRPHRAVAPVPGSALRPQPAAASLSVISRGGVPPANVVNAVVIPVGSVRTGHRDNAAGGQYDREVTFRSAASQGALVGFFAAALKQEGWQVFSQGPAAHRPGTTEVLAKLAGSDGYYWEIGALVAPTSFAGGSAAGSTDYTIRLFQVGDTQ